MKKLFIPILSIFITFQALSQAGVNNSINVDIDFGNGSDAIKASIKEDLYNLNLYEYAHSLPELYDLFDNDQLTFEAWKEHIDSLSHRVAINRYDSIKPYYVVDYVGFIPLQAKFFVQSLELSEDLKERFPSIYETLITLTESLTRNGYKRDEYDSIFAYYGSQVGGNNIWYFLQVEDCYFIEYILEHELLPKLTLDYVIDDYEISSHRKLPIYLQKRKWQSIARRLKESSNPTCQKYGEIMLETIDYALFDNDNNFYRKYELEGMNWFEFKEF
ncbi:hypothetical protein N6H18_07925 [Reichenbachiella agarivorans]|uniref:Uncharacterized protein n=1 Tax=Reichenbachiella agarivorans TaxID=2979464 RepID=A0ABY6CTN8_9BACT|nr:hypothetical protein [Reichenbachiella agarivorans]UXP33871.1 hypothetical protein N6H18_07925 [Reichenbachiella agarivorans]